jgi:carboxylesterase type B
MPNQMKWMDYNFPALPNSGKAINALVHYRLAGLGWMSHPGFVDSSATFMNFVGTNPGAGNYGLMDSINAISWMSQNAVNFGGDPSKITVLGESAGGAHVTMLMASPLTQGLVATFIAESPYITYHSATFSMKARQEMDILYTYRALCTNVIALPAGSVQASSEASCLRAALPLNFVNPSFTASSDSAGVALFETTYGTGATAMWNFNSINCWPVVDGFALTKPPLEAYASGINAAATMVVGHNTDEYELFCFNFYNGLPYGNGCNGAPPFMAGNIAWVMGLFYLDDSCTLAELYAAYMTAQSSTKFQQLGSGYLYGDITLDNLVASDPTSVTNAKYVQMYNDAWFSSGMTLMTEAMLLAPGRAGSTVYTYLSASQSDPQTYTGAYHGSELTYVLNYYNAGTSFFSAFGVPAAPHTPGQTAVNNAFNGYWTSLYHTANPNVVGVGLPHWDPVTFTSKNTMVFSPDLPYGGAMNPCIRAASCKTEPTKDFRTKQVQFYQGSPASLVYTYMSEPTCTAAPTVFNSHKNVSGDVLTGFTCSFLPCCRYSSTGRRSLLFGMPSTSSSSNCDPMC